jgi:hypothetical protein
MFAEKIPQVSMGAEWRVKRVQTCEHGPPSILAKFYLMNLTDARTNFRRRSNMLNCQMNQRTNPVYAKNLWKCDDVRTSMQSHLMWCLAYATLREGLDIDCDKDVVQYFQKVFKIHDSLKPSE